MNLTDSITVDVDNEQILDLAAPSWGAMPFLRPAVTGTAHSPSLIKFVAGGNRNTIGIGDFNPDQLFDLALGTQTTDRVVLLPEPV